MAARAARGVLHARSRGAGRRRHVPAHHLVDVHRAGRRVHVLRHIPGSRQYDPGNVELGDSARRVRAARRMAVIAARVPPRRGLVAVGRDGLDAGGRQLRAPAPPVQAPPRRGAEAGGPGRRAGTCRKLTAESASKGSPRGSLGVLSSYRAIEEAVMRTRWLVGLTGAALGLVGVQASAHHGWAGQQQDQSEITGKLKTDVSLAGAHGSMQIVDDKGQTWDVTLAPAARTERAGLKPGVIPMGATVTIRGNRNSDPQRFEMKTVRVTHDGKNYDVYPDRIS